MRKAQPSEYVEPITHASCGREIEKDGFVTVYPAITRDQRIGTGQMTATDTLPEEKNKPQE
jgi:hypothetical protein